MICKSLIDDLQTVRRKTMSDLLNLPPDVEAVFREFLTCELSTLAKDGAPITWPTEPFFQLQQGRFLITTSIGLAQKAYNIRRNPRVSLLFSNPTGSGLADPPAVLVQGDASVCDEIYTEYTGELAETVSVSLKRQPAGELYSSNPLMRYLFDWYYMRLLIYVTPRRILWWDQANFNLKPHEMEVCHVG
jgi:hypothetical protein